MFGFIVSLITITSAQNYVYDSIQLKMQDAEAYCSFSYGTSLASIHNAKQQTEAKSMCIEPCWVGANRADVVGQWIWTDDTTFDYGNNTSMDPSPWGDGEPSDSGNDENCVEIRPGGWNDTSCDILYTVLCNYPTWTIVTKDTTKNIHYIVADNLIGTMDILDDVYVSFDFVIYSNPSAQYANMLHIGPVYMSYPRLPAMFLDNNNGILSIQVPFSRVDIRNTRFSYEPVDLNVMYEFQFVATQTSVGASLNGIDIHYRENMTSHAILTDQAILLSDSLTESANAIVRNLNISTSNAYVTPFNYLCDYNNRFTSIAGSWDVLNCILTQSDVTYGNAVWMGDYTESHQTSMGWTNYKIEFVVNLHNGDDAGMLFRAQSLSTNDGGKQYYIGIDAVNDLIIFAQINDGWTLPYSYTGSVIDFDVDYTIRVEAEGAQFTVYLNNEYVFNYADSAYSYGTVGFRTNAAQATFKGLRIIFPNDNKRISFNPTSAPTDDPTDNPTDHPSDPTTDNPTDHPTPNSIEPTDNPTDHPTEHPTEHPTDDPTQHPTDNPTNDPTGDPTIDPSSSPSDVPTESSFLSTETLQISTTERIGFPWPTVVVIVLSMVIFTVLVAILVITCRLKPLVKKRPAIQRVDGVVSKEQMQRVVSKEQSVCNTVTWTTNIMNVEMSTNEEYEKEGQVSNSNTTKKYTTKSGSCDVVGETGEPGNVTLGYGGEDTTQTAGNIPTVGGPDDMMDEDVDNIVIPDY